MSSPSSPVHHASLVDPALHSPDLLQLIDIKLSRPIIGAHTSTMQDSACSDLFFYRLCRRACRRYSRLCYGTFTVHFPEMLRTAAEHALCVQHFRVECLHTGRGHHTGRPRHTRVHRQGETSFAHRPRGMGARTGLSRRTHVCFQGTLHTAVWHPVTDWSLPLNS